MTYVVIGAGLAGATAVTRIRELEPDTPVVLIGAEQHPPYERPPLSKGYLLGRDDISGAFVHETAWYAEHDVDLRTGTVVTALDRDAHTVQTSDGAQDYTRLLIATGAQPRT